MSRKFLRSTKASSTAELAAAMAIILPFFVAVLFVFVEVAEFYMVKDALGQCAQTAARKLAISYGQDPTTTMAHPEYIFTTITYPNIVTSYKQFSVVGNWNLSGTPETVTVQVTFTPNANGAPAIACPDPLNLGQTTITSTATCSLE